VGGNISRDDRAGSHESSRPDSNAAENDDSRAERGTPFHHRSQKSPVGVALWSAIFTRRARKPVVDEKDPVTDEDLILDLNPAADERVTRDLAGLADRRPSGAQRTAGHAYNLCAAWLDVARRAAPVDA